MRILHHRDMETTAAIADIVPDLPVMIPRAWLEVWIAAGGWGFAMFMTSQYAVHVRAV